MKMDEYFKKLKDAKVPEQIKADREKKKKRLHEEYGVPRDKFGEYGSG